MKTFLQTSFLLVNIVILVNGRAEVRSTKGKEVVDAEEELVTYVGAVLEYEPYSNWTDEEKGYGVISKNAKAILDYAKEAKEKGADIMVTPEYGLQSLDMYAEEMEKFITYNQLVPDPALSINPCLLETSNENFMGMKTLSCGAIDNQIYLVIDLGEMEPCSEATVAAAPWHIDTQDDCPESGYFFYNTQVVFDRKGTAIARYRKQHLFLEDEFTPGTLNDATAVFLTDFNVLFSLQICFDIVFEHPGYSNVKYYGLRDVVMSTAWVDYLPFELADSVQMGWSRGLGANLLVAGYHLPEKGKQGSGIYREYARHPPNYIYDTNSGNTLLVSNVTTISASEFAVGPNKNFLKSPLRQTKPLGPMESLPYHTPKEDGDRTHSILHENLKNYTRVKLETGENGVDMTAEACSYDNLCCHLTYQYSGNQTYMLMAYSGQFPVGYGRYYIGIQHCAVVWCKNENYNSCSFVELGLPESDSFGPYNITTSSFILDAVYAGALHRDLTLVDYDNTEYSTDGNSYSLAASGKVTDLLVADLLCRWYGNDGV